MSTSTECAPTLPTSESSLRISNRLSWNWTPSLSPWLLSCAGQPHLIRKKHPSFHWLLIAFWTLNESRPSLTGRMFTRRLPRQSQSKPASFETPKAFSMVCQMSSGVSRHSLVSRKGKSISSRSWNASRRRCRLLYSAWIRVPMWRRSMSFPKRHSGPSHSTTPASSIENNQQWDTGTRSVICPVTIFRWLAPVLSL